MPDWPIVSWILLAVGALIVLGWAIPRVVLAVRGQKPGPRRKVAMALWRGPREGYIHAKLEVDVEEALAYIDWLRDETGQRVTITHLVGKAVGEVLATVPEFNRALVWDTLQPHDSVDLSILVALDDGEDVDWVKIEGVDDKSVGDIAAEVERRATELRARGEKKGREGGLAERLLPVAMLRPAMAVAGWYAAGLGGSLRVLGIDRYPFGGAIITSAATFDIDEVYDARTPFGHVSFNVVICRVRPRPVVVDGRVEARRCFNLCVNADHRTVDAAHLGRALEVLRRVLQEPWSQEGLDRSPLQAPPDG